MTFVPNVAAADMQVLDSMQIKELCNLTVLLKPNVSCSCYIRDLIMEAEDHGFTEEQDKTIAPQLLAFAEKFRDSNDPDDAPAVYSAIRTGASMLWPNEANRVLPLIKPGHKIDTRLTAIKMIGRIFEANPPTKLDQHTDIADAVWKEAEELLASYDEDSSLINATIQLCIYALIAMACSKTLDMLCRIRKMDIEWFREQTACELHELHECWDERGAFKGITRRATRKLRKLEDYWNDRCDPVEPEVAKLLEDAIKELETKAGV